MGKKSLKKTGRDQCVGLNRGVLPQKKIGHSAPPKKTQKGREEEEWGVDRERMTRSGEDNLEDRAGQNSRQGGPPGIDCSGKRSKFRVK